MTVSLVKSDMKNALLSGVNGFYLSHPFTDERAARRYLPRAASGSAMQDGSIDRLGKSRYTVILDVLGGS